MALVDQVRAAAGELPGSQEHETWHRPTFRVAGAIYAALHDDLLILRGERTDQPARISRDICLAPPPYRGRFGWVAIPLSSVSDHELPQLLGGAHRLASGDGAVTAGDDQHERRTSR
jgi:hypothetical protein